MTRETIFFEGGNYPGMQLSTEQLSGGQLSRDQLSVPIFTRSYVSDILLGSE